MMSPWILFSPLIVGIIGILLYAIGRLGEDLVRGDGGHTRRFGEFMRARRQEGLTYHDAMGELYMREQLARVRREASDAVQANPTLWFEEIKKAKDAAIERVAAERPELVPTFAPWIGAQGYHHVLYPDEARMVDRMTIWNEPTDAVDRDRYAALKIV